MAKQGQQDCEVPGDSGRKALWGRGVPAEPRDSQEAPFNSWVSRRWGENWASSECLCTWISVPGRWKDVQLLQC